MTTILASLATVVPGLVLFTSNPAVTLGFVIVGVCVLFAARDYAAPRRLTRRGLRAR